MNRLKSPPAKELRLVKKLQCKGSLTKVHKGGVGNLVGNELTLVPGLIGQGSEGGRKKSRDTLSNCQWKKMRERENDFLKSNQQQPFSSNWPYIPIISMGQLTKRAIARPN